VTLKTGLGSLKVIEIIIWWNAYGFRSYIQFPVSARGGVGAGSRGVGAEASRCDLALRAKISPNLKSL